MQVLTRLKILEDPLRWTWLVYWDCGRSGGSSARRQKWALSAPNRGNGGGLQEATEVLAYSSQLAAFDPFGQDPLASVVCLCYNGVMRYITAASGEKFAAPMFLYNETMKFLSESHDLKASLRKKTPKGDPAREAKIEAMMRKQSDISQAIRSLRMSNSLSPGGPYLSDDTVEMLSNISKDLTKERKRLRRYLRH